MIKQYVFGTHALVRAVTLLLLLLALGLGTQSPCAYADDPPLVTTTLSLLHAMDETADGVYTAGPLVKGTDGNYYGTAPYGGPNYQGTVFSITSEGVFSLIYSFSGPDGSGPNPLVLGDDGNFYGTTNSGDGAANKGTIFRITPAGVLTTLHQFSGSDGSMPAAPLVKGSDGRFYGSALQGGTGEYNDFGYGGTLFAITPQGQFTKLHDFQGHGEGVTPNTPLVEGADGNFYGIVGNQDSRYFQTDGGKAFRLTPSGEFTVIHDFPPAESQWPENNSHNLEGSGFNGLVLGADGNFYGMSKRGGAFERGTVFRMAPNGDLTVVHAFETFYEATGTLTPDGSGGFYGAGKTAIFSIDSAGAVVDLLRTPSWPMPGFSTLTLDQDGWLYGANATGVVNPDGSIYGGAGGLFKILPGNYPPPTVTLSASSSAALAGTEVTLTFSSTHASNGCYREDYPDTNLGDAGTFNVTLNPNTNYLGVICSGDGGRVSRMVLVEGKAAPSIFLASDQDHLVGTPLDIYWTVDQSTATCTAGGEWSGEKASSGHEAVELDTLGSHTYTLTCSTPWASATASTTVVAVPPLTVSLTANPMAVSVGQATTLTWNTPNAHYCTATGSWSGFKSSSGSQVVAVNNLGANNFNLACYSDDQAANATVTVQGVGTTVTVTVSSSAPSKIVGQPVTITWASTGTQSCTASGAWSGSRALSGSQQVTVANAGANTYTVTCTGTNGSASNSSTVTGYAQPSLTISATPNSIATGQSATLNWTSSSTTACTASGAWSGSKATSGNASVTPQTAGTNNYTLTCSNPGGSVAQTATVTTSAPAPEISFWPDASRVSEGTATWLHWNALDAQSCTASGEWSGSLPVSGTQNVPIETSGIHSYTLTCSGIGGTATQTVQVEGVPPPSVSMSASASFTAIGGTTTLTWTSTGAMSCVASGAWSGARPVAGSETQTVAAGSNQFRIDCTGDSGPSATYLFVTGVPVPVVSIAANPTSVPPGQNSTLSWSTTNAQSCVASGAWTGARAVSGSQSVNVSASGANNYTLTCTGNGGSGAQSATVTGVPPPTVSLSANPTAAAIGASTTLIWTSTDATSCAANGAWSGAKGVSGSQDVNVASSGSNDFGLTCTGVGGTTSQTASVTGVPAPVVALAANPSSGTVGDSVTLTWSASSAQSCTASGDWSGSLSASGSQNINIGSAGANNYTLTCTGVGGSDTQSVTVTGTPVLVTTSLTLLHAMEFTTDGAAPNGPLVKGPDGKYYGTALGGGPNSQGTVFSITSDGVFSLIYAFSGPDGSGPSPLVIGNDGNFYGTTNSGDGGSHYGTIFRITPAGELTTLHQFNGEDGNGPAAPLLLGSDGNFYGSTAHGGFRDGDTAQGTVFVMNPQGVLTTLHTFNDNGEGMSPETALVQGPDGNYYGTVETQPGSYYYNSNSRVFRLTPGGDFSIVHNFDHEQDADSQPPRAINSLIMGLDGNFYGTSKIGGDNDFGALFRMTPAGEVTTLYSFDGGYNSFANGLTADGNGGFYGTTRKSIFDVDSAGAVVTLYSTSSSGFSDFNSAARDSDGNLYVTEATSGPDYGMGFGSAPGSLYKVRPSNYPKPTLNLSVDHNVVLSGTDVTLTFSSTNADAGCYFAGAPETNLGQAGTLAVTISHMYGPSALQVSCAGEGGTITRSVKVKGELPPEIYFYPDTPDNTAAVGQHVVVYWSGYYGSETCTASGDWSGAKNAMGNTTLIIGKVGANTYTLTCSNDIATTTSSLVITADLRQPTLSFGANPASAPAGTQVQLSWNARYADTCTASGAWSGSFESFSYQNSPDLLVGANAYTLTCTGPGGSVSQTVTVTGLPPPTLNLYAYPSDTVSVGSSTSLNWSTQNAASCTASGGSYAGWSGSMPTGGSAGIFVNQLGPSDYTLTCNGSGGSVEKTMTLTGTPAPTISLTANPMQILAGQSTTLTWNAANVSSCTAYGSWTGDKPASGSTSIQLNSAGSKFFMLNCTGISATVSASLSVTVYDQPSVTLTASPAAVATGQASTLNWTTTGMSNCSASGRWSGARALNGSLSVTAIAGANNYTLSCTGPLGNAGSQTATVTGYNVPAITFTATPTSVTTGQTTLLNWSAADAQSCTASGAWSGAQAVTGSQNVTVASAGANNYTLTCSGIGGSNAQSVTVTGLPPPTVSLSANPTATAIGANTTLTWSSTNATSCAASGAWSGTLATSGSQSATVPASGANTYSLACTGSGGTATQSVSVTGVPVPQGIFTAVPTSVAVGANTSLAWSIADAQSCSATGAWSGPVALSGQQAVTINQAGASNFGLTCTGIGGTYQGSAAVTGYNPPVITFTAAPASVAVGQNSMLAWSSVDAQSCTASGAWGGAKSLSGQHAVSLASAGSASYSLSCTGIGGSSNKTVVVTAVAAPVVTLAANPASAAIGGNTTLTWRSTDANSCTASGAWSGALATGGSQSAAVPAQGVNSYTLTCSGTGGSRAKTVSVTGVAVPVVTLAANPNSAAIGASTQLTWSSTDANSCTASGGWSGALASSGSQSAMVPAVGANSYTLTCSGTGGNDAQTVSVTGVAAPVVNLAANPTSAAIGANTQLTWSTTDASSCTASGAWSGSLAASGSQSAAVPASGANNYTLTCSGIGGSTAQSVNVTGVPAPLVTLSANPTSAAIGGSTTLTWSSTDANSCTASGAWSGTLASSGSKSTAVPASGTNSYTLTCAGTGGTAAQTVGVTGIPVPVVSLAATPSSTAIGASTQLTWSSTDASSCTASGAWSGELASSGSQSATVPAVGANNYTLTCTGTGGSGAKTVSVTGVAAPVVSLAANPSSTAIGASTQLTWSSTDAASCTASGAWSGALESSGSQSATVPAVGANNYTLTCTGTGGSGAKTVSVTGVAAPAVSLAANPNSAAIGGSTQLTWSSTDASSCTASGAWSGTLAASGSRSAVVPASGANNYTLACSGTGGTTAQTVSVTGVEIPVVTLAANPNSAAIGASTQLTWSSTDASSCTASGAWSGALAASGSQSATVPAVGANNYTLTCSGTGGSGAQTVSVTGVAAPVVSLAANPTSTAIGASTQLTWSATDANSCTASGAWSGPLAAGGSQSAAVPASGANSYTLTCSGTGGTTAQTVTVTGVPVSGVTLSANPTSAAVGGNTTLTWSSTDASSCTASGAWSGTLATSGAQSTAVPASGANDYTLTCTGIGGSGTKTVSVTGVAAPVISLSSNPTSVPVGQNSTLSWNATDAQNCTASGGWSGARATSGSASVTAASVGANSFSLSCTGTGGTTLNSTTVTGLAAPTLSLAANPMSAVVGQSSTLSWSTADAQACTASGAWSGAKTTSGSAPVTINSTGANDYTLSCSGPGGSIGRTVTVTGLPPATLSFSANPTSVPVGTASTLSWTGANVSSCNASGAWSGNLAASGSQNVAVANAGANNYSLSCTGSGGTIAKSVIVTGLPKPTVNISANPLSTPVGQNTTLTWSTSDAASCTASGKWSGAQNTSGSTSVAVGTAGDNVYTLTCTGGGGSNASSVTVKGLPAVSLSANPTSVKVGATSKLTWSSTNATSCTATGAWTGTQATSGTKTVTISSAGAKVYTLACTGVGGTTTANTTVTGVPTPTVTIGANPTSVIVGQNTTLTWSSTDATSCTASGSWTGTKATSGTATAAITSTGTKTFTLACTGVGGTTSKSATVTGVTPAANFASPSESTAPGATSTTNITVTLSGPTSAAVTVPFTTGGTAATTSYNVVPSTKKLSFAAGATSATITVNVTAAVCNKTVLLTLTTPTNATLGSAKTNTLTIKSASGCP